MNLLNVINNHHNDNQILTINKVRNLEYFLTLIKNKIIFFSFHFFSQENVIFHLVYIGKKIKIKTKLIGRGKKVILSYREFFSQV